MKLKSRCTLALVLLTGKAYTLDTRRASHQTASSTPKIILDNDWGATDFSQILMALASPYQILGLTSNTGNTWALQTSLHALRSLQLGDLTSCIPVYMGADYPLLNTPSLLQTWENTFGILPWSGAFAPYNATAETAGGEPTSGDPNRISPAAFVGGTAPDQSLLAGSDAAYFMVEQVRKYPGQVAIFSAGALTNIALAVRMDPTFAQNAKELVLMGGYIDTNLLQVTGDFLQADINSDINLKIDPESAKIALTANWTSVTMVANGANGVFLNASDLAEIYSVNNSYTTAFQQKAFPVLPLWDSTALAVLLEPETVARNVTEFYVDVDVAWYSPYYGNVRAYQSILAPRGQTLRTVKYPFAVDTERVKSMFKRALMQPGTCADN